MLFVKRYPIVVISVLLWVVPTCQATTYANRGTGKCIRADDGGDPAHTFHAGVGEVACRDLCDSDATCGGYSENSYNNCLIWRDMNLKGGGPSWGDAECLVKLQQEATTWIRHNHKHCNIRYLTNEIFSSLAEAKVRCSELSSCWGVYDGNCNGHGDFKLCDANQITSVDSLADSSQGSCVDEKAASTLVNLGVSGCTSSSSCGKCQGDCDSDSDCNSGLKCFQRDRSSDHVPGCRPGGSGDLDTYDYCYQEEATCMWRQTASCHPQGAREPQNDKSCSTTIPIGHSGFCDCNGDGNLNSGEQGYDCGTTPGTCNAECQAATSSTASTATTETPTTASPTTIASTTTTEAPTTSTEASWTCSGSACNNPLHCRSEWGYCGGSSPFCNAKSTWTSACPAVAPTTTTVAPITSLSEANEPGNHDFWTTIGDLPYILPIFFPVLVCCCCCFCFWCGCPCSWCSCSGKEPQEDMVDGNRIWLLSALGLRGRTSIPPYWHNRDRDLEQALDRSSSEFFDDMYPVSQEVHESLQQLMNNTSEIRDDLPGFTIIRAVRVEDACMWASYQQCAAEIKETREECEFQGDGAPATVDALEELANSKNFSHDLDSDICEAYLWHATSPEVAMKIAENGFRVDLNVRGRFGNGAYFAEDPGKSDSYAQPGTGLHRNAYAMLLCRVVLGEQRHTTSEVVSKNRHYDSTLAEPQGEAREFIAYRDEQVYPEYAIVYERRDPMEEDRNAYWENDDAEALRNSLPTYWSNNADRAVGKFDEMYPANAMKAVIQKMADETWRDVYTRDRKGSDGERIPRGDPNKDMPQGIRILKVLRVEDSDMWQEYQNYQEKIRANRFDGEITSCGSLDSGDVKTTIALDRHKRRLAADVNELYLWHGSSPKAVSAIAEDGFYIDTTKLGMFGYGAYFAECSSKADEYAQDEKEGYYRGYYAMLLCRVTMGEVQWLEDADNHASSRVGDGQEYDSILGDRETAANTYREFIVPEKVAAYPEYAIIYERLYETARVRSLRSNERTAPALAKEVYYPAALE